jgi:hypothetical protein
VIGLLATTGRWTADSAAHIDAVAVSERVQASSHSARGASVRKELSRCLAALPLQRHRLLRCGRFPLCPHRLVLRDDGCQIPNAQLVDLYSTVQAPDRLHYR